MIRQVDTISQQKDAKMFNKIREFLIEIVWLTNNFFIEICTHEFNKPQALKVGIDQTYIKIIRVYSDLIKKADKVKKLTLHKIHI